MELPDVKKLKFTLSFKLSKNHYLHLIINKYYYITFQNYFKGDKKSEYRY
jgi:hypothetical protein